MPTPEEFNALMINNLVGLIGMRLTGIDGQRVTSELTVRHELLAPNGFLHAGAVVTLADTTCGFGTLANIPEGGSSFATIELKSNLMGTAREGLVICEANLVHGGRTTQVWDAVVTNATTQKIMALFRCTQLIIYPR